MKMKKMFFATAIAAAAALVMACGGNGAGNGAPGLVAQLEYAIEVADGLLYQFPTGYANGNTTCPEDLWVTTTMRGNLNTARGAAHAALAAYNTAREENPDADFDALRSTMNDRLAGLREAIEEFVPAAGTRTCVYADDCYCVTTND